MIQLIIYDKKNHVLDQRNIKSFPFSLGRSLECHALLDDPNISSIHAIIEKREGNYFLRDLGSTNGTYYQNKRITEIRIDGKMKFQLGDLIISLQIPKHIHLERTRIIDISQLKKTEWKPSTKLFIAALAMIFITAGAQLLWMRGEMGKPFGLHLLAQIAISAFLLTPLTLASRFFFKKYKIWELLTLLFTSIAINTIWDVISFFFYSMPESYTGLETLRGLILLVGIGAFAYFLTKIYFTDSHYGPKTQWTFLSITFISLWCLSFFMSSSALISVLGGTSKNYTLAEYNFQARTQPLLDEQFKKLEKKRQEAFKKLQEEAKR